MLWEASPSYFKGDNLPVEQVSWNDVSDFIKKLNEKESPNKYRMPSEAEWEYAARAGTSTRYSFGDDESKLGDYAWFGENSDGKTHELGQKKVHPTPDKKEMKSENTQLIAKIREHKEERNERFLPIFLWTD